jgi:hypothetical protein
MPAKCRFARRGCIVARRRRAWWPGESVRDEAQQRIGFGVMWSSGAQQGKVERHGTGKQGVCVEE